MPYKTTDWLGQSRSSHTTEDCAEGEQGGDYHAVPLRHEDTQGDTAEHALAHGRGATPEATPERALPAAAGEGPFRRARALCDFWTRAAGMHYPLQ